jgi:citronellol/citronellal dehydrogenase
MGDVGLSLSRKAEIMADAADLLLSQRDRFQHQLSWLDEDVLRANGVTDFDQYAYDSAKADQIQRDFYIGTF